MPADRAGRASPLRALMAAVLLLTIIGISGATDREAGGASFANTQAKLGASANDLGVGPVADWLDAVLQLLQDLIDILQGAEQETGQNPSKSARFLEQLDTELLAVYLDSAEADIDQILDGNQYPSLTPVDAGHVILAESPTTLSEHASRCVALAQQAFDEMIGPADHEVVGTKLKTIKALLPEYRTLAGIE
ncbi:MAG: hypothetical protein IIA64_05430 [Planctomycetes bacterium]|nr:hypothetical protein [Planctomycetota bacterium]